MELPPTADDAGAVADYSQAIKLNPKSSKAFAQRSAVLLDMGDYKKSSEDLDISLKLKEQTPSP